MSDNREFIAEARQKCAMSIRNTAVGDWLGDSLRRLEEADAENERLREKLEQVSEPRQHSRGPNGRPVCSKCGTEEGCHGGCDCTRSTGGSNDE